MISENGMNREKRHLSITDVTRLFTIVYCMQFEERTSEVSGTCDN
ncbi:MAG: hypothetical protein WC626_06535 [Methanoregula sp.]